MALCLYTTQAIAISNQMIEQTALKCGDDSDHARNLAQLNISLTKIVGPFILCLSATFNFWQITEFYLGKQFLC